MNNDAACGTFRKLESLAGGAGEIVLRRSLFQDKAIPRIGTFCRQAVRRRAGCRACCKVWTNSFRRARASLHGSSDARRMPSQEGAALLNHSSPTLALIHTSPTLAPAFTALCRQHIPEAKVFHMVDESLIQETIRAGALQRATIRRTVGQIASAEEAGANAVLVTCSSIGAGVALASQLFDIPVLRIDDAMAEAAVRQARKIGVLATLRTTLDPTTALLRDKAAEAGRSVELVECLCEEAFPAVLAGDTEKHDSILRKALLEDLKDVEAIVLAQASMARVVATLAPGSLRAPVFSSPEMAVLRARRALGLPDSRSAV